MLAYEAAKHHAFKPRISFLAEILLPTEIAADNMLKNLKMLSLHLILVLQTRMNMKNIKVFEVHEACKRKEIGVEQQHAEIAIMAIKIFAKEVWKTFQK